MPVGDSDDDDEDGTDTDGESEVGGDEHLEGARKRESGDDGSQASGGAEQAASAGEQATGGAGALGSSGSNLKQRASVQMGTAVFCGLWAQMARRWSCLEDAAGDGAHIAVDGGLGRGKRQWRARRRPHIGDGGGAGRSSSCTLESQKQGEGREEEEEEPAPAPARASSSEGTRLLSETTSARRATDDKGDARADRRWWRLAEQVLAPALEGAEYCALEAMAAEMRYRRKEHEASVQALRQVSRDAADMRAARRQLVAAEWGLSVEAALQQAAGEAATHAGELDQRIQRVRAACEYSRGR